VEYYARISAIGVDMGTKIVQFSTRYSIRC
jgi:hypothetical protein